MESKSIGYSKSYQFSLKIIHLCKEFRGRNEQIVFHQLLKSATSISANLAEAQGAHSRKDFNLKITISFKESLETFHWLSLMTDAGMIPKETGGALLGYCEEIVKILKSTKLTLSRDLN